MGYVSISPNTIPTFFRHSLKPSGSSTPICTKKSSNSNSSSIPNAENNKQTSSSDEKCGTRLTYESICAGVRNASKHSSQVSGGCS